MAKGRQYFAKGGRVQPLKRKKFADGGTALTGPTTNLANANAVNPNTGILGTIGGALGLNNNFQASGANINPGTNTAQLNQAYTGVQGGLDTQAGLTNTLIPQAATGVGSQNVLTDQLLAMSQGQGPNPALNQLAQSTGQNVSNQAALAAGQRGASGNVGLMARQAAQTGAGVQQQAAGQAATQAAQQQIAAQGNLANLANNQINQAGTAGTALNTAQQNEQSILQNANAAANNNAVGMQSNINNTNAQTAGANQGMAGKILGGVTSAVSGLTSGLGFAQGGEVEKEHHVKLAEMNAAALMHGKQNFAQGGEAGWAGQYFNNGANSGGGGGIEATQPLAQADQTSFDLSKLTNMNPQASDAMTKAGYAQADAVLGAPGSTPTTMGDASGGLSELGVMAAEGGVMENHFHSYFSEGGEVPAMVSPGEIYLSPDKVKRVVEEGIDPAKIGEKFSGKAKVKGDSLKNDTIPKTLQEGGVVIDRKNMGSKEKRELFVHRSLAKKKTGAR